MSKKGYFLGGILLGGLIGAGVALLCAPCKGEETRKKLKKWTSSLEPLQEKTEVVVHKTMDAIKSSIDKLGKIVDDKKKPHYPIPDRDIDSSEAAA